MFFKLWSILFISVNIFASIESVIGDCSEYDDGDCDSPAPPPPIPVTTYPAPTTQHRHRAIWWNGKWAHSCEFPNTKVLTVAPVIGEHCSNACQHYEGCTHFEWHPRDDGVCTLKAGQVTKADARIRQPRGPPAIVCGIV